MSSGFSDYGMWPLVINTSLGKCGDFLISIILILPYKTTYIDDIIVFYSFVLPRSSRGFYSFVNDDLQRFYVVVRSLHCSPSTLVRKMSLFQMTDEKLDIDLYLLSSSLTSSLMEDDCIRVDRLRRCFREIRNADSSDVPRCGFNPPELGKYNNISLLMFRGLLQKSGIM